MVTDLFVVVCRDRHCDDSITVHATLESANREIERFKASYKEIDRWVEQSYGRRQGWLRYVDCYDDGPDARIEKTTLRGVSDVL
jgi:hypothetical protein